VERRNRLHEQRTTPWSCGTVPGSSVKDAPARTAGDRCTTDAYRRAITRACDQAFPPPAPLAKRDDEPKAEWRKRLTEVRRSELDVWRKGHRWHSHQRRAAKPWLRRPPQRRGPPQAALSAEARRNQIGIEAARIIPGHRSAALTGVQAEEDEQQAVAAVTKVG
jgi:hypothetical protein